MFKAPFSFNGRIRRTEFGISFIIYMAIYLALLFALGIKGLNGGGFLVLLPAIWFLWAQGAKRCHDLGNSGWWQLIPFYVFWLLFADGVPGENEYGDNPKNKLEYGSEAYEKPFTSEIEPPTS